ncbi:MAG TPA: glycosyltransferase family 9 protein [Actinocrinis sp.]|nr:glycosyltransferase family 9 protein [Actinocrinis sp.]
MRVDFAGPAFFRGSPRVPADGLVTKPLGYVRDELGPGEPLPGISASGLPSTLKQCDEVVLSFGGKLGDTLLAFGAVAAVLSYLELIRPDNLPVVRILGQYAALFDQLSSLESFDVRDIDPAPAAARTVVVGDRHGVGLSLPENAGRVQTVLVCDPEEPPCWSSGTCAYPSLPARYFLDVERQLGMRLFEGASFMPVLYAADAFGAKAEGATMVGLVTATSWPARKDYGLQRYFDALSQIAEATGSEIHALVVPGREDSSADDLDAVPDGITVEVLSDAHFSLAGERLAGCDLVFGNDTGLTHLAAAIRQPGGSGAQVIGLHARHSHAKWRTGLEWHHALATPFSETMNRNDLCPVRDKIDDRGAGAAAEIGFITPEDLAAAGLEVLGDAAEASQ